MIDVIIFVLALSGVLAWYLGRVNSPRSVWAVAFLGFAARVGFVLVDDVLRVFAGSGDANAYERALWFVAELWHAGVLDAPMHVTGGPGNGGYYEILYTAVLSPVYFLFGREPMLIRLAMGLLGALIVVNVYLIGRELLDGRAGLWGATITAFFPYWIYLNGILYRDTLAILFFTWMAYYLLRWQKTSDWRALGLCLLATALAVSLRLENLPALAALFGVVAYTKFRPSLRQKAATGLAFLGLAGLFLYRFGETISVQGLAGRRRHLARERPASYLTDWAYESVPELIAFAPIGMLYFTLVPFPWQAVNALAVISILQNLLVWYPVVVLAVLGARDMIARGNGWIALPLVAFALTGLFTYGLVEGNIGPSMRHRSQFQFVFLAFASVALSRRLRFVADTPAPAFLCRRSSTETARSSSLTERQ